MKRYRESLATMPVYILSIINEFKDAVKLCIRDELSAVIVYGSYAREDYHNGSDIDIMILVDTEGEKLVATSVFAENICVYSCYICSKFISLFLIF